MVKPLTFLNKKINQEDKIILLFIFFIFFITMSSIYFSKEIILLIPIIFIGISIYSTKKMIILLMGSVPFYGIWVFPYSKSSLYIIIIPIMVILLIYKKRKILVDKKNLILIFIIFFLIFNSFATSINSESAKLINILDSLSQQVILIVLLLLIRNYKSISEKLKYTFILFSIFSGLISVFSLLLFKFKFLSYSEVNSFFIYNYDLFRILGGIGDPNYYARILGVSLFFLIYYDIFNRYINSAFIIINSLLLIFTFSKLGFILLVLNLIYFIFKLFYYRKLIKIGIIIMILFIISFSSFYFVDYSYLINNRIFPSSGISVENSSLLNRFSSGRINIWKKSFNYWVKENPRFLFVGMGGRNITENNVAIFGQKKSLHNSFLDLLFNSGFIVLILYILFLGLIFKQKPIILILIILLPFLVLSGPFRWDTIFILYIVDSVGVCQERCRN